MSAALCLLASLAALADADRVQLSVERALEASSCPDHHGLAERVRERIGSEPFVVDAGGAHRRVAVTIFAAGRAHADLVARVVLTDPAGQTLGQRELLGARDCATLADELTLAVAMAVDPLLLLRPPDHAGGEGDQEPGHDVDPRDAPGTDDEAAPYGELGPVPRRSPDGWGEAPPRPAHPPTPAASARPVPPPPGGMRFALHAQALGSSGVTGPLAPGLRAGVSVDHHALFAALDARAVAPARWLFGELAGSVDARTLTLQASAGGALTGYAARLRGGLVAEAGVLSATGVRLAVVREAMAPWVAVGGRGGLEIELARGVALVLDLEALFPLLRPRYVDGQTGDVLDVGEQMVWSGGLGLALATW